MQEVTTKSLIEEVLVYEEDERDPLKMTKGHLKNILIEQLQCKLDNGVIDSSETLVMTEELYEEIYGPRHANEPEETEELNTTFETFTIQTVGKKEARKGQPKYQYTWLTM